MSNGAAMSVFMTKTWGFGVPASPLQFGAEGDRDRARNEKLEDGDLVVFVGTLQHPTPENERGRVLAIVEPTKRPVRSLDYPVEENPWDFNDDGTYKWPYALTVRRAWRLLDRPHFKDITDRSFDRVSARTIVPLTDDEAEPILGLRREEVPLAQPLSVKTLAEIDGEAAAIRQSAPPPTTTRRGSMHMRRHPAFTYAMRIEGAHEMSFKIGWAFDYRLRQRQFNRAALPQLGGLRYRTCYYELWDTARQAFSMEQSLLASLRHLRQIENCEVVSGIDEMQLLNFWNLAISDVRSTAPRHSAP